MAIVQQPGVTRPSGTTNSPQSTTVNLAQVDARNLSPDLRIHTGSADQAAIHALIARLSTGASPA